MSKKRLPILFLIIVSIALMTYQGNKKEFMTIKFLNNMMNGLHSVVNSVIDSITSPFKMVLTLKEENKRLKAELNELLKEQKKYQEVFFENKRLRELLSLKERQPGYVTSAAVIAKGLDPWSNTLILDKGHSHGIKKDMTAINNKGLVGKILDVSNSYSTLLLLTDIKFSAAARLQESRIEGVISGTGFRKCQLKYIPYEEEIKTGDTIITSGRDLIFPAGIPVGYVSMVSKTRSGPFQYIEVTPFEDTTKIEEVAIIKGWHISSGQP